MKVWLFTNYEGFLVSQSTELFEILMTLRYLYDYLLSYEESLKYSRIILHPQIFLYVVHATSYLGNMLRVIVIETCYALLSWLWAWARD